MTNISHYLPDLLGPACNSLLACHCQVHSDGVVHCSSGDGARMVGDGLSPDPEVPFCPLLLPPLLPPHPPLHPGCLAAAIKSSKDQRH